MQMTGEQAQHVELRNFQVEEICRAFGVYPQMVGHSGNSTPTFASAEQFFIAHAVHTLGPWYAMIEQSIEADLLQTSRPTDPFARFTVNALLRGAMNDEANYFAKARGPGGWMTANDVRALKDMNPLPGGDELPPNSQAKPTTDPTTELPKD
jgi:HK97 family phage portal protein